MKFECSICSFVYRVEAEWVAGVEPAAPVHPVHLESGKVNWRMCAGSARRGVAVAA
jgi:hypothetical protein